MIFYFTGTGNSYYADRAMDRADPELQSAITCMRQGKPGDYNKHRGFLSAFGSPMIYRFYSRKTKPFHVTENCNGCGYCRSVCPVEAIKLEDGTPRWVKVQCEFCLACYHRCPQAAIRHGSNWLLKGQYLNPRVTLPLPGSDHEAI